MQYMLKNKNFPRLELKIATSQHLQHLTDYLEGKWLKGVHQRLLIYPDPDQYLRKVKAKGEVEPLNKYFMMTDVLSAYDWPKNNVVSLYYDIELEDDREHPREHPQQRVSKCSKPQKRKDREAIEEEKHNPFALKPTEEPLLKPPTENSSLLANHHRYESSNFEEAGGHSFFKRSNNSNSFLFGHCSNSFMGGFEKVEDSNLDMLRETIKLVEDESRPEETFKAPEDSKGFAVPVIKRKGQIASSNSSNP